MQNLKLWELNMSTDKTNENFHRQNLSNTDSHIINNYIRVDGVKTANDIVNSENERLLEHSALLNKKVNRQIEDRLKIEQFDHQINKKLFSYFKKIIAELETTIEVLKLISADNSSLHDSIKNMLNENGLVINNVQKREKEIDIMLSRSLNQE